VVRSADVVICGAGPAGVAAALASAASGADTVLIESAGCLGGVWTSGLLTYVLDPKAESPVTRAIVSSLEQHGGHRRREHFDAQGRFAWARHSFIYDAEIMKWVLERECLRRNVQVRMYSRVCAVVADPADSRRIAAVVTESKSGREAWKARVFIDATGDGDVAAQAGCAYELGRPDTGEVQPLTLMCLVQTPHPERVQALSRLGGSGLLGELKAAGVSPSYGSPVLFEIRPDLYGFMMNHKYGSALDAGELSQATMDARDEVMCAIQRLKSAAGPWEGISLVATAGQIGVREGRRIVGRHRVTVEDLKEGRRYDDNICTAHFPVDVHSTKHAGQTSFDADNSIKSQPYDIPLRALIAADKDNLLMAGRNISGDFIAHSSYRVTGNSVAMGEAAGCLAACAAAEKRNPHAIDLPAYRSVESRLGARL
jgi:hypothetical protein